MRSYVLFLWLRLNPFCCQISAIHQAWSVIFLFNSISAIFPTLPRGPPNRRRNTAAAITVFARKLLSRGTQISPWARHSLQGRQLRRRYWW